MARGSPKARESLWAASDRVEGVGFRVEGLGFRVEGLGFGVEG